MRTQKIYFNNAVNDGFVAYLETDHLLQLDNSVNKLKRLINHKDTLMKIENFIDNDTFIEDEQGTEAEFTVDEIDRIEDVRCFIEDSIKKINIEIEKLETLQRTRLLTAEKQAETKRFETSLTDAARLEQFKPYFKNCSSIDLETIIEHKQLPIGRDVILWIGTKADAIRFIDHFKMTKAQFNKTFYFADGIKLHNKHKDKDGTTSPLSDILENFSI
jgi:uncharacterized protein YjhX (UPF0386 family)